MKYKTFSARETLDLGENIAQKILIKRGLGHAIVFALVGDLGSGKTVFAKGFARGLGIKTRIVSPTFTIKKKYRVCGGKNFFVHMDVYRIQKTRELEYVGFFEEMKNKKNIVLVEWASTIRKEIPKTATWIFLKHGKKVGERIITIKK